MERLDVANSTFRFVSKLLGLLMLALSVIWFVLFFDDDKVFDLVLAALFLLNAVFSITEGFGLERTWLAIDEERLYVKWYNMLKMKSALFAEIESVNLGRFSVQVSIKGKRPLKLKIDHMTVKEKAEIYDFLILACSRNGVQVLRNQEAIKILK
jgi:hypothetical protein